MAQDYKAIDENENMSDAPAQMKKNDEAIISNFAGADEPTTKMQGQLYFDTSTNTLKFYNGSNFVANIPCNITGTAARAKADESGRVIADTYLSNIAASNNYLSVSTASEKFTTLENKLAPLTYSNAAAHNKNPRGKFLGNGVTAAQWAAIKAGTFDDLYIGDYWTIGGIDYVIAAFDYYLHCGDTETTVHHVTIVPRKNMYTHVMNDTNVVTGAYIGSKMYKSGLNSAKTTIANAFGSNHILTIRQLYTNATNADYGFGTGFAWYSDSVYLMNEMNVYGSYVFTEFYRTTQWSSDKYSPDNSQFPIFAFDKTMIHTRQDYWLRNVAYSGGFAFVGAGGTCTNYGASYARGVRPVFNIYQS